MLREARLGHFAHAIEHFVDVDGRAGQRARIAERFHAVDQSADPMGLLADELCELLLVVEESLFQQLRRAANAGERILDLMRENGRHAVQRADGAAMGKLPIQALRKAPLLQRHKHRAVGLGDRRDDHVRHALAVPRCRKVDIVLADRGTALARLGDHLDERAGKGRDVREPLADQQSGAHVEKLLSGRVHKKYFQMWSDQQDRHWQRSRDQAVRRPVISCTSSCRPEAMVPIV